jgi:MSHA biogenesis protein MshN
MSLINQMLQDLERRSSGLPSGTQFEPAKSKSLGTDQENENKHTFLKVSGTLILLYCAVFMWVKNPESFRIFKPNTTENNGVTQTAAPKAEDVVAAAPQPQAQHMVSQPPQPPHAEAQTIAPEPKVAPVQDAAPVTKEKIAHQTPAAIEKPTPIAAANNTESLSDEMQEEPKKPTKKLSKQRKPAEIKIAEESLNANDNFMPILIGPQSTSDSIKAGIASTENKKSKSRNANNTAENSFSKQESTEQKSANLYRQALLNIQQGRAHEAQELLMQSIDTFPANEEARQTLAALLVDTKKIAEAQQVMQEGLNQNPKNIAFRMAIARLQLESQSAPLALETMTEGLSYGRHDGAYQSFLAILLQRTERHDEAVAHFNTAIQLRGFANDYVGLGISLTALKKFDDAKVAFTNALQSEKLTPELKLYAEQQIQRVGHLIAQAN